MKVRGSLTTRDKFIATLTIGADGARFPYTFPFRFYGLPEPMVAFRTKGGMRATDRPRAIVR